MGLFCITVVCAHTAFLLFHKHTPGYIPNNIVCNLIHEKRRYPVKFQELKRVVNRETTDTGFTFNTYSLIETDTRKKAMAVLVNNRNQLKENFFFVKEEKKEYEERENVNKNKYIYTLLPSLSLSRKEKVVKV